MSADRQRAMLTQFLKERRSALSPEDVGLSATGRRRAVGLRREEVGILAEVSTTWYTWLEQGRDISVSADALERLTKALKLTADQREYLFALVQGRPAPWSVRCGDVVPQPLMLMLEALSTPALIMTYRWDIVAWNSLTRIFQDYSRLRPNERNFLRILVTDPAYRTVPSEYEEAVRRAIGRLRVDYSQAPDDPVLDALIDELLNRCPIFRRIWEQSPHIGRAQGVNVVHHLKAGGLAFDYSTYIPEGEPQLRLVLFAPHDDACAEALAGLSGKSRATSHRKCVKRTPSQLVLHSARGETVRN